MEEIEKIELYLNKLSINEIEKFKKVMKSIKILINICIKNLKKYLKS